MKIIIQNGSNIPIYEQIKNGIKENILLEKVQPQEQLPSVRELSKHLKVSILTVKKAYDELEAEGFITIRQGLGTFVAASNEELKKEERQKELEGHLQEAIHLGKRLDLKKQELMELFEFLYGEENE